MQNFKTFWGLRPWTPTRALPWTRWGLKHSHTPSCGHCLSHLCMINTTQNSHLTAQRPQNNFCANLQLAKCVCQFTKPGNFFKSPRAIFTYLPESIWETIGFVTEGCATLVKIIPPPPPFDIVLCLFTK